MKHPIPPSSNDQRLGTNKMRLPFEPRSRRSSASAWIYRHRVGLLVTVVIYLSIIILFLSYRIIIAPPAQQPIAMEFEDEKPPEPIPQVQQQEVEQIEMPVGQDMRNRVSDANSKLDASVRDSKSTNASEIYKEAERVKAQMSSGAEAYNRAMHDLDNMGKKSNKDLSSSDNSARQGDKRQTANYKGSVSVVWDLANRTDVHLHIPAYQCQYAGMVVVGITVNVNGRVIAATVDKTTSSDDPCINEMAVKAAFASSFNASPSAPDRQRGTITYTFTAQTAR
ncbi:MAG: energy transducer TonB [Mucinivorans sp.]